MILGIDASTYLEQLDHGAVYRDGGGVMDPLAALRRNGVDHMRLRLWNHPYAADGTPYLGGTCDLPYALRMARLAHERGYRLLLDFHYSDFWTDPAKQCIPKAWVGLDREALAQAVYTFTRESLEAFRAEGLESGLIQVGNEITNGMLWPAGALDLSTTPRGGYDGLIPLLKAGVRACREVFPRAGVILHLERSGDAGVYQEFFSRMAAAEVDYDIIGASYYPQWHGSTDRLFANLDACACFGKPRMLVETACAFTLDNYPRADGGGLVMWRDNMDTMTFPLPYPATPEGQRDFLARLLELARAHGLAGVFYWEPLWTPVEGSCWASEAGQEYIHETGKSTGNEWANQCLFDYSGRKLPAFDVFRA